MKRLLLASHCNVTVAHNKAFKKSDLHMFPQSGKRLWSVCDMRLPSAAKDIGKVLK